jgi:DNA-binding beta-propeller fold protein YncE
MKKLWTTVTIIILMLVFIGYIVFDLVLRTDKIQSPEPVSADSVIADQWLVERIFDNGKGKLKSVAISAEGKILLAGESYIACYDPDLNLLWETATVAEVTAVAFSSDRIYAAIANTIEIMDHKGKKIAEWGPYDEKTIITSVSANDSYVAFADAGGKSVYILDTGGELKYLIGQTGVPFIIPSAYFDIALGKDNTLHAANTGNRRIERRKTDGTLIDYFGEAGLAPDAFCGCCNPAHFALLKSGYVTAEKGVNRIKILDENGGFKEFVSSVNEFLPPFPLDIAVSPDESVIYGANPADSKLYIFKRK